MNYCYIIPTTNTLNTQHSVFVPKFTSVKIHLKKNGCGKKLTKNLVKQRKYAFKICHFVKIARFLVNQKSGAWKVLRNNFLSYFVGNINSGRPAVGVRKTLPVMKGLTELGIFQNTCRKWIVILNPFLTTLYIPKAAWTAATFRFYYSFCFYYVCLQPKRLPSSIHGIDMKWKWNALLRILMNKLKSGWTQWHWLFLSNSLLTADWQRSSAI